MNNPMHRNDREPRHDDRELPYYEDQRRSREDEIHRDYSSRDFAGRRDHWNDPRRTEDRGHRAHHSSRPYLQRDSYDSYNDDSARRSSPWRSFDERSGSPYSGSYGPPTGSYGQRSDGYGERSNEPYRRHQPDSRNDGPQYGDPAQSGRDGSGRSGYGGFEHGSRQLDSRTMAGGYSGDDSGYGYGGGRARGYGGVAQTGGARGAGFGSSMGARSDSGQQWSPGPNSGKGPKGYRRSDERLIDEVSERLERHGDLDASNIEVTCENGVITLQGTVACRRSKRAAEDEAEQVYGVHDVTNQLKVQREAGQDKDRAGSSEGGGSSKSGAGDSKTDSARSASAGSASASMKR